MSLTKKHIAWFSAGALWSLMIGPAVADDTELFLGNNTTVNQGQPNILFILDNSGSMGTVITTREPYNAATVYAGSCSSTRVYWKSGADPDNPPNCSTTSRYFNASALKCEQARQAFTTTGLYQDRVAQFDDSFDDRWESILTSRKDRRIECLGDSPTVNPPGHGDGSSATAVYAQDGFPAVPWSTNSNDEINWGNENNYVLYSANYINWWNNGPQTTATRLAIMQEVASDLLDSINGVNVGLMHFNTEQGGRVAYAMEDVATARTGMKTTINALTPTTWTPLSETLYEAGLYYMGRPIDNGTASVAAAKNGGDYDSPLNLSCQRNFAIMLTDGEPTRDDDRDAQIQAMTDEGSGSFASLVGGSCDIETYPAGFSPDGGECLDDLAEFLVEGDLSTLPGQQAMRTYTIGFDIDLPILADTAARGGGEYRTANDVASLTAVLTDFVLNILDTSTTFSAPAVSINSFNRTRNLNDLFISVFSPKVNTHWPGNLKKYRLRVSDSTIVDADGDPAVDVGTGFFAQGSRSFWTPVDDGPDVEAGGAAQQIPLPASRNVYTHLTGNPNTLISAVNSVHRSNALITDAVLNTGVPGEPTRDQVIDFIRGLTPNGTTPRNQMGDPLHSQPVSVIYDGADPNGALVFFATNDGYLHAVNPNTGVEQWAFVPEEFLADQTLLFVDESSSVKHYGIDSSLRVQMKANNDSVIDAAAGEKVYLTFGMRRGGSFYYSLDVSDPANPQLLWRRGSGELIGNGQSWANAVPARIDINDPRLNADKLVLVIAGGYDPTQDGYDNVEDNSGNSIYIVDSVDGDVLWQGTEIGGDESFSQMDSSFPADIKVVDLNTDGFADRMYAADMGGQVWRFDIWNGNNPANLVTGGVIAQLGAAPLPPAPTTVADGPANRRFFYSPDVALVANDDYSFIHIGIGSGYRAHPLSLANHDRFYALRDYDTFGKKTNLQYSLTVPITDNDLTDVTNDTSAAIPQGDPGWRLELRNGGSWVGEKVLAEARTFNNQVFFTTFLPSAGGNVLDPCSPAPATNRLYIVDLFNGSPVVNMDGDATPNEEEDRYQEFPGTITSEVVFIFPSPDDPANCVGDECAPPPVACVDLFCFPTNFVNNPVRTFWSQESIE